MPFFQATFLPTLLPAELFFKCDSLKYNLKCSSKTQINFLETWGIYTRRAGKLYKARSRLYQSQSLQVNTHVKALVEIYTIHSFAQLESNLKTMKSSTSGKRHADSFAQLSNLVC